MRLIGLQGFATVKNARSGYDHIQSSRRGFSPFRHKLRQWERENQVPGEQMAPDVAEEAQLYNAVTRPQNVSMLQVKPDDNTPLFLGDELIDLRSDDAMLDAGDLVELRCVFQLW